MKKITYTFGYEVNRGPEEEPQIELITNEKSIECSDESFEDNYAIAQREAVGEITVEDLLNPAPTTEEKIEAQVTYTAMMTDTLLPKEE